MSKSNFEDAALALVYSEQGQKYQAEGNYEAAIKAYGESLRLFPFKENVGTYYNLGGCYYKLKDYRRAIDYYTQTLQINPDNLDAYYNRGTSRSQLNDYPGAIEDYTQVISRNPEDANAYELRGGCYFKMSNIQQAMSDFQIAAKLYLSQGNLVRYQRIMALPGMGSSSKISSNSSSSNKNQEQDEERLMLSRNVGLAIGILVTIVSGWNWFIGIITFLLSWVLIYILVGSFGKQQDR